MNYEYKNFIGVASYNKEEDSWSGKIVNIPDIVTFGTNNILELRREFMNAVNDYIELCREVIKVPFVSSVCDKNEVYSECENWTESYCCDSTCKHFTYGH